MRQINRAQGTLFDTDPYGVSKPTAAARDAAIDRVDENADEAWKKAAAVIVERLCRTRGEFTTDDVWKLLADSGRGTHEPRAMGAVMRTAATGGLCANTGRVVKSVREECHNRPVAVWRSLVLASE